MNSKKSIVVVSGIVMILIVIALAGCSGNSDKKNNVASTNAGTVTIGTEPGTTVATEAPTAVPTEIPEEITKNVDSIKEYILETGFSDEEGVYYIGYTYGEWLYCSMIYDKNEDILCLKNSYYTSDGMGDFYEMLAVWDNFPYSSTVLYCENHFEAAEGEDSEANAKGTLAMVGTFEPDTFTAESVIELYKSDESTYEAENLDMTLEVAEPYTVTSFSYWDEILEWTFELNLKDFGMTSFERSGYASVSE